MTEKEYCAKRSSELRAQMIQAIQGGDHAAFRRAFETAQRYMKRGELKNMMMMYITHMNN